MIGESKMPKKTLQDCIAHCLGLHYTTHKDWGDEETQLCEEYELWDEKEVNEKVLQDAKSMFEFIKGK